LFYYQKNVRKGKEVKFDFKKILQKFLQEFKNIQKESGKI